VIWRRAVLTLAGVTVLAGSGSWVVGFTGVFGVRQVAVHGASDTVPDTTVRQVAAVPLGGPLAQLDLAAIADRVERLPGIAHARVSRAWPSTARIDVVERVPVAVVPEGPALWLIDVDGVLFQRVAKAPATLPTLVLPHPRQLDQAGRAALAVLGTVPASLRAKVGVVEAPTPYSVTLGLRDGRTVIWGGPDDAALKAKLLVVLLTRPGTMFDVSSPSVAVVR
jgi:cell division protein FtsQ